MCVFNITYKFILKLNLDLGLNTWLPNGTREFRFCDPSPRICNTKFEIRILRRIESTINLWSPIQNRHEHRHFAATALRSCPARSAHALRFRLTVLWRCKSSPGSLPGTHLVWSWSRAKWCVLRRAVSLYGTQAGANLEIFKPAIAWAWSPF